MDDWWKDPRLDDEGTYDYLIEPLPRDYAKWEFSRYKWKCDNCGKESHLRFVTGHYFYCWDGYDCADWDECWRCRFDGNIYSFKNSIKKRIRILKTTIELFQLSPKCDLKKAYKLAKQLEC